MLCTCEKQGSCMRSNHEILGNDDIHRLLLNRWRNQRKQDETLHPEPQMVSTQPKGIPVKD